MSARRPVFWDDLDFNNCRKSLFAIYIDSELFHESEGDPSSGPGQILMPPTKMQVSSSAEESSLGNLLVSASGSLSVSDSVVDFGLSLFEAFFVSLLLSFSFSPVFGRMLFGITRLFAPLRRGYGALALISQSDPRMESKVRLGWPYSCW